jgi:DNA-binding transcriptional LysR family regulator
MNLRQLRYFVVLAEELHFRRAAERLHITQSPLTVAIQGLERDLGGRLFRRTQRHVELTAAGGAFLLEARSILDKMEGAIEATRKLFSGAASPCTCAYCRQAGNGRDSHDGGLRGAIRG